MADGKYGPEQIYTDELAERILDRIAQGESLTKICEDDAMPCRMTVWRWRRGLQGAPASFCDDYAHARVGQAEAYFDDVVALSDAIATDPTHEKTNAAKLRVDSRKWVLARMDPGQYGDRTSLNIGGEKPGEPVRVQHTASLEDMAEALRIATEVSDVAGE